jgi:hypothetical protein
MEILNISQDPVEVPRAPVSVYLTLMKPKPPEGVLGGGGVVLHQRVRGTFTLEPNTGFAAKLDVDCSTPGEYHISVRMGNDDFDVRDATVRIPAN